MKTLIVYDTSGYIYVQMGGVYRIPQGGVLYLEIEIPASKRVVSVNVETKTPVYENIPKTEFEILQEQVNSLTEANAELTGLIAMGNHA